MKRPTLMSFCLLQVFVFLSPPRLLAGCPCEGDVNDSGSYQVIDTDIVRTCAEGISCSNCVNDCDVDCDGDIDWMDVGAVECYVLGLPADCCAQPSGACTDMDNFPSLDCRLTTLEACEQFAQGTYHGNGTICVDGQAVTVPATSAWGLFALAVSILIFGTLVLRRQPGFAA